MANERLDDTVSVSTCVAETSLSKTASPATKSDFRISDRENGRSNSESASLDLSLASESRSIARSVQPMTERSVKQAASYRSYRRICDELVAESKRLESFLVDGKLNEEGLEVVVEIEHILDELYNCKWGEGECIKRVVVAIWSQIKNVQWEESHTRFVRDISVYLRNAYLVNDATIKECFNLIREHGLEVFRGSLVETSVRKRYKIVEAD